MLFSHGFVFSSLAVLRIQRWWRKLKKRKYIRPPSLNIKANRDKINQLTKTKKLKVNRDISRRSSLNSTKENRRNIVIDLNKLEHNFQTGFHPSAALNSRSNLPQILSKGSFDQPVARSNSIGTMISSNLISHQHLAAIEKPPFHQSIRSSDDHVYDSVYLMKLLKDNSIDKDMMSLFNEVLTMLTTHNNQYEKNFHKMLNMEKLKISSERQDDEDPTEAYRLSAISLQKPRMKLKDELAIDTFKEKFVSSKWIKKLKHESHKLIEDIKAPAVIKKETFLTNDQRFFQKVYGNMNLGALRAVDKAYEERSQNDDKEERNEWARCESSTSTGISRSNSIKTTT